MRVIISLCGFVFIAGALSFDAFSEGEIYGTLTVVKGDVQVIGAKDHQTHPARAGARVFAGDSIQTGHDSRAKVTMVDSNVLNISPDTKMQIEKYEFNPTQNKKNVILSVDYGKLRSTVNQKYDGEENKYHVKTPSAVAGVRGTDFLVSFDKASQSSQVVTFRGQVEVGSSVDSVGHIVAPVKVNPGQATSAAAGRAPSIPALLPPQQLNNLNQNTTSDSSSGNSTSNSKTPGTTGRAPASLAPNPTSGSSATAMAPTTGDMTNTSSSTDVGRAPAALSPLLLVDPVAAPLATPALLNPDLIKGSGSHLTVIIH